MSFTAIGVLILKTEPLIGAPLLILSAVIWSIGLMRRTPGLAGFAPKRVLFVTICVLVIAAVALTMALAGHSPTACAYSHPVVDPLGYVPMS